MIALNLSSEKVRSYFDSHLSYDQITENDIEALRGYVCLECARHNRDVVNGTRGVRMWTPCSKRYSPIVRMSKEHEGIQEAYLFIDGPYFKGREAISFNRDGFVGFAGWADSANLQPFLQAFMDWMHEWKHTPPAIRIITSKQGDVLFGRTCPSCGAASILEGDKFCQNCGAKVVE